MQGHQHQVTCSSSPRPTIPYPANNNNVVFEQPQANQLFNAIQHDDRWLPNGGSKSKKKKSKKSSSPALDSVSPSKVKVEVLNGSGTQGMASQVGSDLTNEGFNVVGTGDANNFGYTSERDRVRGLARTCQRSTR